MYKMTHQDPSLNACTKVHTKTPPAMHVQDDTPRPLPQCMYKMTYEDPSRNACTKVHTKNPPQMHVQDDTPRTLPQCMYKRHYTKNPWHRTVSVLGRTGPVGKTTAVCRYPTHFSFAVPCLPQDTPPTAGSVPPVLSPRCEGGCQMVVCLFQEEPPTKKVT